MCSVTGSGASSSVRRSSASPVPPDSPGGQPTPTGAHCPVSWFICAAAITSGSPQPGLGGQSMSTPARRILPILASANWQARS